MKRRIVLGLMAGSALCLVVPAAQAGTPSATVPPACVVATGPNGVTLQIGYAPNGPADCTHIP